VLGPQHIALGPVRLYLVLNPSGANAHFTPSEQTQWYDRLAEYVARRRAAKLRPSGRGRPRQGAYLSWTAAASSNGMSVVLMLGSAACRAGKSPAESAGYTVGSTYFVDGGMLETV
jgi:hypothetical protein